MRMWVVIFLKLFARVLHVFCFNAVSKFCRNDNKATEPAIFGKKLLEFSLPLIAVFWFAVCNIFMLIGAVNDNKKYFIYINCML